MIRFSHIFIAQLTFIFNDITVVWYPWLVAYDIYDLVTKTITAESIDTLNKKIPIGAISSFKCETYLSPFYPKI